MALETTFLGLLIFSVVAALLVSTILFFKHKKLTAAQHERRRSKLQLPPGDMGLLPWIGETMDFYKAQKSNRLFEDFVQPRAAKHGKIFKTKLMGSPTVVLNGAEANRFLLTNEFKLVVSSWPSSSVRLMGSDSIMTKEGEKHRQLHGIIAKALGQIGLEAIIGQICDVVKSHLETEWEGREEISLYRSAKLLTFTIVFECLLGIKVEAGMLETFEKVLEGVFAPVVNLPGFRFHRAMKAREEIERMIVRVVRAKRKEMEEIGVSAEADLGETRGILLSRLVVALIKREISEKEVVDNVILLVFGAHDTTSFAIAMTFKMLAHHPNCYRLLHQEHVDIMKSRREGDGNVGMEDVKRMNYTWQVARESMRLFPPIFGSFRQALVDIQYQGFTIPKGWKVLWITYGTHYDPECFPEPNRFDPSRFDGSARIPPYTFLPFGGGPRLCAGYQLARTNILAFLHFVTTRYDWSLVRPDEPVTLDPLPFPMHGMPIRISPKSALAI